MISMDISSQQGLRVGSCCFAEVFRNWRRCKDRWTTKTTIAEPKAWNSLCEGLCLLLSEFLERFSYDLERKTCEQNRNNKRTEIERFDWFIERIQTRVAFGWLSERSGEKNFMPEELSRNQSILRFDVILQHDWPIEQCCLYIRVFFGGKTKNPCFGLCIHWLIKRIMSTYRNDFSRWYEKRSIPSNLSFPFVPNTNQGKRPGDEAVHPLKKLFTELKVLWSSDVMINA